MSYADYLGGHTNIPNFISWARKDDKYVFDSSLSPKYSGRYMTAFLMGNFDGKDLVSLVLAGKGPFELKGAWKNMKDAGNVSIIENAYHIAEGLKKLKDWRINVPDSIELCLVKAKPFDSVHPAFIMEYKHNDFFQIPDFEKERILEIRDQMVEATKEHGFIPSLSAQDLNNFIYSKVENRVYLIGFGLWKRK